MIPPTKLAFSRYDRFTWCNVWSKIVNTEIKAVLKVVMVPKNSTEKCPLENFIKHEVDCLETLKDPNNSGINSLLGYMNLLPQFNDSMKMDLANIIELIKCQSFTCLQGIPHLSLESLIELLNRFRDSSEFDLFE